MRRLIAIAMATTIGALGTACAERGPQPIGFAPGEPSRSATSEPSPTRTPAPTSSAAPSPTAARTFTYEAWFMYDGRLFVSHRTEPFDPAVGATAIEAVLGGPNAAERGADLSTFVTPGSELLGLSIADGVATVDLSDTFVSEETPAVAIGSLSQIVYTITQFGSVDGVRFEVEGTPLTNFGGYELDGPQRRANFEDQLPLILVESPAIGERVSSPATISGTADVFEAVVSIVILDEAGETIASTFTMATCGTGCRGTFTTDVRYDVASTQLGTVRVFEVSAMDGSPIHVVDIPVTLTA
jgi:Immunoglobulin-like domain of bacterial spore germination/Sporulation and spore germination